MDDSLILAFADQKAWARWLGKHHEKHAGLWLRIAKKGAVRASVSHAEALETALGHGWIDAQRLSDTPATFLQKFVPRRPRSIWSKINREKALALIDAGKMKPAGLRAIEQAKQNGRWESAYDSQAKADVPADLEAALARSARAKKEFDSLDSRNRYAILHRLQTAKKEETRARRLKQFVEMLQRGERLHPESGAQSRKKI